MGVRFFPDKYLKKVMPKGLIKNGLVYDDLTIKKTYLKALVNATSLSGRQVDATVYKVLKQYRKKERKLKKEGVKAFKEEALNDQALLTQRVENLVVSSEVQRYKEEYKGKRKRLRWLPSEAEEPRPEHQLRYGKEYWTDELDVWPGEEPGCQCGFEILD